MSSTVPGADPVQQVVHDFVFEPVADEPADPRRTDPPLLPQHAQRLGDRVLRSAKRSREVADANPRRAVQNEQYLQAVGIGEQIEALGPAGRVNVGQRRRRTLDLHLVTRLFH
jgi:hypothetical protein